MKLSTSNRRSTMKAFALLCVASAMSGCSALRSTSVENEGLLRRLAPLAGGEPAQVEKFTDRDDAEHADSKIANPPAKTIRFSGSEVVLGLSHPGQIAPAEFKQTISEFVADERFTSGRTFIERHPRAAKHYLWNQILSFATQSQRAADAEKQAFQFVSQVASMGLPSGSNWKSLSEAARGDRKTWTEFTTAYAQIMKQLQDSSSENDSAEAITQSLRRAAEELKHPIVMAESLRLLAARELVEGRFAWAESLCLQASEVAAEAGDFSRAAELMLEACRAIESQSDSDGFLQRHRTAWETAIDFQLSSHQRSESIDEQFWELADEARMKSYQWPSTVGQVLISKAASVGCDSDAKSETLLWTAVAAEHYDAARFQQALLCFKKAEKEASETDKGWLRIAQGKCLASLGQEGAAAAILSGPATSDSKQMACAAKAALGSAKLAAGAYQQGAQLLNRALSDASAIEFAGKLEAQADLAVAITILGDLEQSLDALQRIQYAFQQSGDRIGLIQAYENEQTLCELEGESSRAQAAASKIAQLERDWR